jgi:hypothetical protein
MIHIPNKQYQHLFLGDLFDPTKDQRLIIMRPDNGTIIPVELPAVVFGVGPPETAAIVPQDPAPLIFMVAPGGNQPPPQGAFVRREFKFRGSLFGFDRRLAVEISSSLPLTQSALIEDNKESSDFILGRFMYQTSLRHTMDDGDSLGRQISMSTINNNVIEFMNGTRRIMYHRLHPQDKISTLRIHLYARVRTYDEASNDYQLKSIALPTVFGDWWHIRLHFQELTDASLSVEKKKPVY